MTGFWVSVDIGGTFTDCLVENEHGDLQIFKASSTPGAFEQGFLDVLAVAAKYYGLDLRELLAATKRIVHGSTVSTNALVEGHVATTGLICNAGHPDVLMLREAVRKPVFEWSLDYPDPYVPRRLTAEVRGRMSATGVEIEPLNEQDVRDAVELLRARGVEAIGVSLLWSVVDGRHETRVREIIHEQWPDVPVTLGHELNPIAREYRRTISTVIDASLHPIVSEYVKRLQNALADAGFQKDLLLANCLGGMMPPDELVARPILSVMSGPTLAPVAAKSLKPRADVLVADMGGTTFDVSAIRDGDVVVSAEAFIGSDMLGIPKIDVRSIGAGGGSIAWVDDGGLLRVGPRSAGAYPGPACYGRGGTLPTVTDANVVLGTLDPDNFLGGRMKLDRDSAYAAIRGIGEQLGLSPEEAAYAIYTTSNNLMVGAITDVTVHEGINPRDSALVVGGGATPSHICDIAAELGIRVILVPRFAAGLSAYGGLISDIRWEEQGTAFTDAENFDAAKVNTLLQRLRARGAEFLDAAGIPQERREFSYSLLGRYQYQSWEIEVPFTRAAGLLERTDGAVLAEAFHDAHERIYTIRLPDDLVEFTSWKVSAIGRADARPSAKEPPSELDQPDPSSIRSVYVRARGGMTDVPVFTGGSLRMGSKIVGPAVIEEPTTTIFLTEGAIAVTDAYGNYHLVVPPAKKGVI